VLAAIAQAAHLPDGHHITKRPAAVP
jgi:hypothetical protein